MHHKHWTLLDLGIVFAALVVIAAAFMPWAKASASAFGFSVSTEVDGTDSDGLLTLLIAVAVIFAVIGAVYGAAPGRFAALAVAGLSIAIIVVAALALSDIKGLIDVDGTELENLPGVEVKAQLGLYLTLIAGIAGAVMGLASAVRSGTAPS